MFCVSQPHAARITNILNKLAFEKWYSQYGESDFAMQVTSQVQSAQQMTLNFSNNRLGGESKNPEGYETSKARIAVTVGMMTTGYDCPDLLNIALMRPVFSPSDFVQIKGRGTRKHLFEFKDYANEDNNFKIAKSGFKFFDFFATCEYFENEFPYDEEIKLPQIKKIEVESISEKDQTNTEFVDENGNKIFKGKIDLAIQDEVVSVVETLIGLEGMRIDREGFKRAIEEDILENQTVKNLWQNGDEEEAEEFIKKHVFDKPKHFLNLEKIRKIFNVDRRISTKEFLQAVFEKIALGLEPEFLSKDDLLENEWQKFMEINHVDQEYYQVVKMFFKAYVTDQAVRQIIASRQTARFYNESSFHFEEYQQLNGYKTIVPQYVNDYAYHLTNL